MMINLAQAYGINLLDSTHGIKLHDEIAGALSRNEDVTLDFVGVGAVVSAFFNPAVGQLYREFKPETLGSMLKVVNSSPVHRKVLSQVIENAKRYVFDSAYEKAEQEAIDRLLSE